MPQRLRDCTTEDTGTVSQLSATRRAPLRAFRSTVDVEAAPHRLALAGSAKAEIFLAVSQTLV
jgi:hypothetical protein